MLKMHNFGASILCIGSGILLLSDIASAAPRRERHKKFVCTQETGTFPDPYTCESYWLCSYGAPIARSCNFGLVFDNTTLNCGWAKPEICTIIDGKPVRGWSPDLEPPPPAGSPTPNGNGAAQSKVMSVDGAGNSSNAISSNRTRAEKLAAYEQIIAKWRYSGKRLKQIQSQGGPTTTTTRAPSLTGPPNFDLPDGVTKAPRNLYTLKPVGEAAIACDKRRCRLPDCYCDAQSIPGGLSTDKTPQIVMVTFDDAVNGGNIDMINHLFRENRTNPNGCPITGTFFLANGWTDYNIVRELYGRGHEIASHSLSHQDFTHYNKKQWRAEIVGEAQVAHEYAGVNMSDIVGMRAPFLAVGGDTMYKMLWDNGFLYDSSIPSGQTNPPLWPYTFDSPLPHACFQEPCPKSYFPGLWEVPMTYFVGLGDLGCSMYDACTHPSDEDDIADLFYQNFMKHYSTNRSPFLLSAHSAWYQNSQAHENAMETFMDRALKLGDVYFVAAKQAIYWMQTPTPLADLKDFKPWQCAHPVVKKPAASTR